MIGHKSANELKTMMDENQDFILVDCREDNEWAQGRLPHALHIPLGEIESRANEIKEKKQNDQTPIILQCRSGKRSMNAALILEEQGLENLFNLDGGIIDWAESGYEVVE